MRSDSAAAAQDRFGDDDWGLSLMHRDADPLLTAIFAGIVLAVVSIAGLASADGNAPTVHLAVSRATSDCKDPGSGPPPPNPVA